ncbi:hypothetical protein BKA66DRAFT_418796, partial [Pyrenochaeta sp. MPI-SDFR-AT-0127]
PAAMSVPVIHIEDWSITPIVTGRYVCRNTNINFHAVYVQIKSLLTHPKCVHGQLPSAIDESWPCSPCEQAFLERYWSSAAHLLDYFADFVATDTPLMRSIWFHLLDVWQEGATWLPYQEMLDTCGSRHDARRECGRAALFAESFKETLILFDTTILGVRHRATHSDPIIHTPSGEASSPAGEYETGPWISGLKPWEQFLCEGSPGVVAASIELPNMAPGDQHCERVRYIPMAAIGIVKKHTERARTLAVKMADRDADTAVEVLDRFDQNALRFPAISDSHTYTSMTGQRVTYRLTNGAPPIVRYPGFGDPSMLLDKPSLTLLDECVAVCKGGEAYEPQSGQHGGGSDDDGEEADEEDEEAFDMWALCETEWSGEGGGRAMRTVEGWGEMFEYWCVEE